ncbi:auxin response factor 1 [Hibiscus trionum]|uniref:Auxin response factor n=1 Tax=Hibiscus trionum TaxID=183268 RepID=A0A9W7GXS9_HIBTR|nr:auxin response factor 1 [Hibiscus trionum]
MDGERNGFQGNVLFHSGRRTDADGLRSPNNQGERDELWHACAGPCVYVPRVGEKVLYFPQGHMEQVDACMNQDGANAMEMPIYNLPSKILCSVMHVQLKVEPGTDEVFAQITLLPEAEQDVQALERMNYQSLPRKAYPRFFSKKLTPSDTSTHGGFSIPKRLAVDGCLPLLDMSQQPPQQELVARDLHGFEWRFRHIYRGQPKRHLLTSGWSTFLTSKKLVSRDTCIFLRGENGELRVGIRRAATVLNRTSTSIISGHSMRHGILASAFHAFSTRSMFTVYHRPWSGSSEFIISFSQYMKSARIDYSVGTRFRMQFEGEECEEQRASGTIVSVVDIDHIRWPNSEWRCLKVKWDPTAGAILLPERVCPWNIEPMEFTKRKKPSILHNRKKARTDDASSPGLSSLLTDGMLHGSINHESQSISGVLQGQEDSDTYGNQSGALRQPIPHTRPLNHGWGSMQQLMQNRQMPVCGTTSFSSGEVASFGLHNSWLPTFSNDRVHEDALASRKFSVPNANSQTSSCEPNGGHAYMLFGVNLIIGQPSPPSPQHFTSSELESLCSIPPTSQSTVSEPSKGTSSSVSNRSCAKVLKYRTALGRSVDLTRFDGYKELIGELDRMFDFKGRLVDGSSGWDVSYTDDEGDTMMIGDHYPWQRFQYEVRRMLISPKEETGRLNPSSPNSKTSH